MHIRGIVLLKTVEQFINSVSAVVVQKPIIDTKVNEDYISIRANAVNWTTFVVGLCWNNTF